MPTDGIDWNTVREWGIQVPALGMIFLTLLETLT